jgi:hypothetical protein
MLHRGGRASGSRLAIVLRPITGFLLLDCSLPADFRGQGNTPNLQSKVGA